MKVCHPLFSPSGFVVGGLGTNDGGIIECIFPLTGRTCVSRIITELGVFDVDFEKGLTLVEIAEGVEVDEIRAKTSAPFAVSDGLKPML